MGAHAVRSRQIAASTAKVYDYIRRRQLSPRVRLATRLWAAGMGSKAHIARSLGISPITLYTATMPSIAGPDVMDTVKRIDQMLEAETVDMAKVLQTAGRRAIRNIANTMENGSSEVLKFKAAQDLADRSPETSKTQKVAVASFNINAEDAKELARSMVEAAAARERFAGVAEGDFVKVNPNEVESLPAHAERMSDNGR